MRNFNAFMKDRLSQDNLKTFSLIFLDFRLIPIHLTSLPYNVTATFDGNTYQSDVGIIDFSVPVQTSSVDRQSFSIGLSDHNSQFKNSISRSEAGRRATFYLGFFNDDGTPNTEVDNVLTVYDGYIDETQYTNDFDMAMLNVTLSSPMADLSLVNTLITNAQGMDQINENDTSFDKVIDENEEVIKWGKV